ncbi:MAG: repressor LexA [Parachlamydiales bacterium]|nr:repressor LexA [Parachlamydiales bacterium]
MVKGLTKRQREVLEFIKNFISRHQYSPSYREIQLHFNLSSLATVSKHVHSLSKKGLVQLEKGQARSLNSTQETKAEISLPLTATITAGQPIQYLHGNEKIALPSHLVTHPQISHVMKVQGDGFKDEQLMDGDLLLVEKRASVFDNETTIVTINQTETYIMRYNDEGDVIRLTSGNPNYRPISLRREKVLVEGILILLLRLY